MKNIRSITTGTQLCAVIGDPIAHSLSPAIHNAAIDALDLLLEDLDIETHLDFNWLVDHGLEFGIWVVSTLPTSRIHRIAYSVIESFKTKHFGKVDPEVIETYFPGIENLGLQSLVPGLEAVVNVRQDFYPVWIPQINIS